MTATDSFEESKTTSREIELRGDGKPVKLVWIEQFRTGRSVVVINGKKHEFPFEFREGWDLQTREAKD